MKYSVTLKPGGVIPRDLAMTLQMQRTGNAGDIGGPLGVPDKAVAIFDGITGKLLKGSLRLVWDASTRTLMMGDPNETANIWGPDAAAGSDLTGGEIEVRSGSGDGTGFGGSVRMSAGPGGESGGGGVVNISAGDGGSTIGDGGIANLLGGNAQTDGIGGNVYIGAGQGAGAGAGGDAKLIAGATTGAADGGDAVVGGGFAAGSSGNGGEVQINGGVSLNGVGGDVHIRVGTGPTAGRIFLHGVPTSDPGVSGAIWRDAGGFLKQHP